MKILFVTAYPLEYNTSGNIRNLGLIEGLMGNRHDIFTYSPYPTDTTLFTGNLLSLPFKKRYWIDNNSKNIPIINWKSKMLSNKKLKGLLYKINNYINVYDSKKTLVPKISADSVDNNFDIIISSSDPKSAHLFAEKLIQQNPNITNKWIQYWGDPFSGDISTKRLLGKKRIKKEELRLLKLADKAVYVSPFTKEEIQSQYPECADKIEFLPIPYRLSKSGIFASDTSVQTPVIGYMGDYYSFNRNLLPLYNVLKSKDIKSYIIGGTDLKLTPTENLTIKSRLQGLEFQKISEQINIIICVCNLKGTQIPGKIYHYVNTNKPIMIILDGERVEELEDYFKSYNRFYICNNNEISIENCLTQIIIEKKKFEVPKKLAPFFIAEEFLK